MDRLDVAQVGDVVPLRATGSAVAVPRAAGRFCDASAPIQYE